MSTILGAAGVLRAFDVSDQAQPLSEIRQYLAARYDKRFDVPPKQLEDVVVSVYRDLGYEIQATGRTGDGGVDAVLRRGQTLVGIQVKRYRGKIEAEAIRSFAGALYLKGMPAGIYVTTSAFTRGARHTVEEAGRRMPIYLVDAARFYEQLGIVQRKAYDGQSDPSAPFANARMITLASKSNMP